MEGLTTQKLGQDVLIFFATINPVATLGFFLQLTPGFSDRERASVARRAVLYATLVLVGALVLGQLLLEAMHVSVASFQVAGGVVLFLFALQMIFAHHEDPKGAKGQDPAIFPLAMPVIASPEAILAAVLLTDNHVYPIPVQAIDAGLMLGVLLLTYLVLRGGARISRLLGQGGIALLVQITGLILASLSVEIVAHGVLALVASKGATSVHTSW
ncbi:MarC family protein [Methylacidimicrobium sp. B4]|uniref:MarC family protein n=1 Tax=Methylacidimicrobium sp. B4 TaxID=2796139 RepID=UPI001A8EE378|nr:MarC family protein [Methylacidimicrobium sp. B4]QSR84116.1 MarC family protein [Methylacidimicrobium sp. B4]